MGEHAMIELKGITAYGRSTEELEELLLVCAVHEGQGVFDAAVALDSFLRTVHTRKHLKGWQPLKVLRGLGLVDLAEGMKSHGLRSHKRNARAVAALVLCGLDLRTCTVAELEKVPGITPSAARLFVLHARPD